MDLKDRQRTTQEKDFDFNSKYNLKSWETRAKK